MSVSVEEEPTIVRTGVPAKKTTEEKEIREQCQQK
jgi:hypothetical protein